MHILFDIVLFGAVALYAAKSRSRRGVVAPEALAEARPQGQPAASARRQLPEPKVEETAAAPIGQPAPVGFGGYVLGGARAGAPGDRTAAMMAMMSGPGVCTPPEG